ncbi:MAG: LysR family transcriptional regulator [Thermodesulfobacteriota bacterium]|nr:LysR family transcriptional regulator [Thermodesulfobacteriota bacterium]
MKIRTKVWIDDDQDRVVFGSGRARMLEAIDRLGSMNKAAKEMKMSYRAVWGRIKSTEERLGAKILATSPGGGKRRGSILTPTGKRLLEKYRLLKRKIVIQADQAFEEIFGITSSDEK